MTRAWIFASAVAVILAAALCWRYPYALDSFGVRSALAALVVAVSWRVYGRKPQPPKPAQPLGTPDKPNRRWARMMYANGLISMEELNAFYASHPENENDSLTS